LWFSYLHQDAEPHASVHDGSWKLVAHGNGPFREANPMGLELYDLDSDPGESRNLADRETQIAARLHKHLREFIAWQQPGVGPYAEGREGFQAPRDWVIAH
jgi:hypothetical protein